MERRFYEDRAGDEMIKGDLHAFSYTSVEAYGSSVSLKSVYKSGYISISFDFV